MLWPFWTAFPKPRHSGWVTHPHPHTHTTSNGGPLAVLKHVTFSILSLTLTVTTFWAQLNPSGVFASCYFLLFHLIVIAYYLVLLTLVVLNHFHKVRLDELRPPKLLHTLFHFTFAQLLLDLCLSSLTPIFVFSLPPYFFFFILPFLLFHSSSSLAALASSYRHSTPAHIKATLLAHVCACAYVCLEQSLQWGHIGCEWPTVIYCRQPYIFPSQSTKMW